MPVYFDASRGTWFFVIDLPHSRDGKRKQMRRRGFRTQQLASRAEGLARLQVSKADLAADGTVAAELAAWLAERELDVALTTLGNYRNALNAYVVPYLGARQVYDLDKRAVNDLYRLLLTHGSRAGRPLSASTVRHVHRTLMKALKDLGVVIEGVRQPRPSDRETAGRKGIWTAAQCSEFLAGVADDRLYLAWVLVVVCGLRRGELAGLKWPKVDLPAGLLHVHWQRAVIEGGVLEKEPKGKSRRTLALGPALIAEFGVHQLRQQSEIDAFGLAYRRGGYVFCKEDGTPYHPKYFTDRFRALCASAGVPIIVLHDGRHTSATVGADHGVPQHAMQQRLGHSRATLTQEVYTHVLPDAARRAAQIMEDTILG